LESEGRFMGKDIVELADGVRDGPETFNPVAC
jgi:hypothetical protein